jgi:zinc/manganese transport system ATP-binding protein
MTQTAPAVELRHVRLSLGGRVVLDDVSFALPAAGFVGLLGPNGAGKTSLLRAMLGLIKPVSGQLEVLGRPAARGNVAVGYMPQSRAAAGNLRLSGRDFVAGVVNGEKLGLPFAGAAARREVDWALSMVDAQPLARRPLAELSGGERQRLLLAQALIGRPKLLLLDEPLMSLDPHHQAGVVALVKQVQTEMNILVVFSAHEINPLLHALDRVLYLGGGHAAMGTVDEVITGPVLSRLYGAEIEVLRLHGRIFVLAGDQDMERDSHRHAHG